jgi:predicted enzyme related to lactoylglutathione lyase
MSRESTNPVVHLELHTGDLQRARSLYSKLCGWPAEEITAGGCSYLALDLGAIGGGAVECATPRPSWLPYIEVPEIAAATERARSLGGSILLEPREGPSGWRSVVSVPDGAEVALWQPKR